MAGTPPTPTFGADFRDAIRFAMTMGAPADPTQGVTFIWARKSTFATADPAGHPYNWRATPATDAAQRSLQVPCALQWGEGTLGETPVGQFDSSKVTLTLLDQDWEKVKTADSFQVNGVDYVIDTVGPPLGMFDVTVFQVHGTARG